MRNLLLMILVSLTFGSLSAQDAAPAATIEFSDHPARVVGNINGLNVRSTPAIETDNIVGRLQPGQQVHVIARDGAWQQVRSEEGLLGWSHSDYLIDLPPRQIGDKRLFNYLDSNEQGVTREVTLRHIGEHVYIYIDERDLVRYQDIDPVWLNRMGQLFDQRIYPETEQLWNIRNRPSHEGDERIIILLIGGRSGGFYVRSFMQREPNPYRNRVGFITAGLYGDLANEETLDDVMETVTHELHHAFERAVHRGNEEWWVSEGLASFGTLFLGYEGISRNLAESFFVRPETQLTIFSSKIHHYGASMLFVAYIFEQLGLEGWRAFATHPARGLDALDAVLDEIGSDRDADSFFADFVLANYLRDTQYADGRFGYQLLSSMPFSKSYVRGNIVALPTLVQQSLPIYATDYFDFVLPDSDQPQSLELALDFPNSATQDGWLQFVQVVAGEVILQRFRASDYRNRMMSATLQPDAEQAFLAVSPFRADARYLTAEQPYILKIHLAGSDVSAADYSSFESSLSPDSAEPARAAGQRSPAQLAKEIDAILDEIIENDIIGNRNRFGEYFALVEERIASGAAINGTSDGSFLVKVMERIQSPALLALFLESGADPNLGNGGLSIPGIKGTYLANPLNYAVMLGDSASLRLLLDAGATVDNATLRLASTGGVTNYGGTRIISMLLADGVNSSIEADGIIAAAEIAREYRHHAAADMLEAAAAN